MTEEIGALHRRANRCYQQRRFQQAAVLYQRAVSIDPTSTTARNSLGAALRQLGKLEEAEQAFKQVLRQDPESVAAHNNFGNLLHDQRRLGEAEVHFRRAVQLKPDYAQGYTNLGLALRDQNKLDAAIAQFRKAIDLAPTSVEAYDRLAGVLRRQDKLDEARQWYSRAEVIAPQLGRRLILALTLPAIRVSLEQMNTDRRGLQRALRVLLRENHTRMADPLNEAGMTNFSLAYQGMNDRDLQADLGRLYAQATPSLCSVAPHCRAESRFQDRQDQKIRIGFISRCFYDHTIARLNAGYIRNLSRDRFHVTVCRTARPDDKAWNFIRDAADECVMLPRQLEPARQVVTDQRLDVLFYTDIGMDALTYLLAFARLAPVQCVTWGHPVTTGIENVDYFLSSVDLEPPDADAHYTEKLVRFKHPPTFYYAPSLSTPARSRRDFGLDPAAHIYLCPQTLFKLHPEFDSLLARILQADSLGELVLIDPKVPRWKQQWLKRFSRCLPNAEQRVRFVPRQTTDDFLHLINIADVLLDPLHFGGGNTTYEATSVGTPIVTLPGQFMRGRVTYACYRQMGVTDCIAHDEDEYVDLAVRIGTDQSFREKVKGKILANNRVLYKSQAAIEELEQFLVAAVKDSRTPSRMDCQSVPQSASIA